MDFDQGRRASDSRSHRWLGGTVLKTEKIIAAVGVADEDVAHLRLLMRKAVRELSHPWRWGSEASADLFVVDTRDFAGQMARTRAHATGMRVAVFCDAGIESDGDLALYRPLKLDNVVNVLNAITDSQSRSDGIVPQRDDFYFPNEHDDASPEAPAELATLPGRAVDPDIAQGFDEMMRGNSLMDTHVDLEPSRLDASIGIEVGGALTPRSEARMQREPGKPPEQMRAPAPNPSVSQRAGNEDHSAHHLRAYLKGGLLGGPVQIAWPDAGVLSLDPKNQVFHSDGALPSLEIYCRLAQKRSEWRALTSAEIGVLRESQPAQSYAKLVWLDVLLHSGGKLAAHLDPGGTYRLKHWLEIRRDYPGHARIAAAMMQPLRLHEIAAAATSKMSDVFDLVNAYDAIGSLEWSKRAPRHAEAKAESTLSGWMQRLRKPFGKD